MHRQSTIRRLFIFGAATLIGMGISSGVAAATPASEAGRGADTARGNAGQTSDTKDCDGTHHSKTGHGANDAEPHAYNETCDGSPSGNGKGDGKATGKPCAGCVGNADDKNPPGQYPDGSDHNAGYECDRNQGIGKTNPAHTGCNGTSEPAREGTPACPAGDAAMTTHRYVLNGTKTVSDLTGKVHPGDTVKAIFTIAAGCADVDVALTSYSDTGATVVFDTDAGRFSAGEHTLTVDIADCAFQVDFHAGTALIDTDEDMTPSCAGAGNGNGNGNPGQPQQPQQPSAGQPAGSPAGPSDNPGNPSGAVLGTAISAATGTAPALTTVHAPVDVLDLSSAVASARPAEVLGVQLTRNAPAAASLARTGAPATTVPLVALGGLLCVVGLALTSVRRRSA